MSRHVKDKISLYIDGKLEGAALQAFEAHMKTCGECGSALAETKQAVKAAKGTVKDADLPVNFYVKLNKKLDAVDAAGKAPAFNWGNFARGAVAVCTMLIVGVFVYTLNKQTNNFSDVRMKQDEQMPAVKTEEKPRLELAVEKSKDSEEKAQILKKAAIMPEEPELQQKMELGVDTSAFNKKKMSLEGDEKMGYSPDYGFDSWAARPAAVPAGTATDKNVVTTASKSAAPAPGAKMKMAAAADTSAGAGMVMDEAVVGEPAAEEAEDMQPQEESVTKSMAAVMARDLSIVRTESGNCGQELAATKGAIAKGYLQAIVSGRTITVYHKDAPAACGNPTAVYSGSIGGNSILIKEKYDYVNGMAKCMCKYVFSVTLNVPAPGTYNITVVTDDNGGLSTLAIDVIVE